MKLHFCVAIVVLFVLGCAKSVEKPAASSVPAPVSAKPSPVASKPKAPVSAATLLERSGVPQYPGAEIKGQASTQGDNGDERFTIMLSTADAKDKVIEFYKNKLKVEPSFTKTAAHLVGRTPQKADVILDIEPTGKTTKITIHGIVYKA